MNGMIKTSDFSSCATLFRMIYLYHIVMYVGTALVLKDPYGTYSMKRELLVL